jgi:hypothetical protein
MHRRTTRFALAAAGTTVAAGFAELDYIQLI